MHYFLKNSNHCCTHLSLMLVDRGTERPVEVKVEIGERNLIEHSAFNVRSISFEHRITFKSYLL